MGIIDLPNPGEYYWRYNQDKQGYYSFEVRKKIKHDADLKIARVGGTEFNTFIRDIITCVRILCEKGMDSPEFNIYRV